MIRKLASVTLMIGALAFVVMGVSRAADEKAASPPAIQSNQQGAAEKADGDKKQEKAEAKAITHTKKAIEEGKAGKAAELAQHAETALKIAEKADKRRPEAHVEQGIKHLQMAVEEGKKGNAAEGTKHAQEALAQLEKK